VCVRARVCVHVCFFKTLIHINKQMQSHFELYTYMQSIFAQMCRKCGRFLVEVFLVRFRNVSITFARFYTTPKVIRFIDFITCCATSIIPLFVCTFETSKICYMLSMSCIAFNIWHIEYLNPNKKRLLINNNLS